jgi:hypothetical protein
LGWSAAPVDDHAVSRLSRKNADRVHAILTFTSVDSNQMQMRRGAADVRGSPINSPTVSIGIFRIG